MRSDSFKKILFSFLLTISFGNLTNAQTNIQYDIVLIGGRVIDPETKLDTIKNVGIINNRIAQISSQPLKGKETVNVSGLVVPPALLICMYMAEAILNRNTSCMMELQQH
jgi:dihydroorotase